MFVFYLTQTFILARNDLQRAVFASPFVVLHYTLFVDRRNVALDDLAKKLSLHSFLVWTSNKERSCQHNTTKAVYLCVCVILVHNEVIHSGINTKQRRRHR